MFTRTYRHVGRRFVCRPTALADFFVSADKNLSDTKKRRPTDIAIGVNMLIEIAATVQSDMLPTKFMSGLFFKTDLSDNVNRVDRQIGLINRHDVSADKFCRPVRRPDNIDKNTPLYTCRHVGRHFLPRVNMQCMQSAILF